MDAVGFRRTSSSDDPPRGMPAPLAALWWDAKGNRARAHALVDELETQAGMAVDAYLHRKECQQWNAEYWYKRSGRQFQRGQLEDEWAALAEGL